MTILFAISIDAAYFTTAFFTCLFFSILTHLGFAGPPQRVLSSVLHSFLGSDQAGVPFRPTALPVLGLSEGDKQCIRDRSCIMARHIFADKSEEYIQSQVLPQSVMVSNVFYHLCGF